MSDKKGPGLLNIIVADKPIHGSTKTMVQDTKDPNIIVVPYYLPRPYYKN